MQVNSSYRNKNDRRVFTMLPDKRFYLCFKVLSSETVSLFLPFLLREANTLRPLAEAILSRKPCLFFLFLFEG
jgi:hypothetical protein